MAEPTAADIIREIRETSSTIEEAADVVEKFAPADEEEVKIRRRRSSSSRTTTQVPAGVSPLPPELQPEPVKTEVKKIDLTSSLLRGGTQTVEALGRGAELQKQTQAPLRPEALAQIEREQEQRKAIARATRDARERVEAQGRPELITARDLRGEPILSSKRFRASGQALSTVLPFLPSPTERLQADITSKPIKRVVEVGVNNPFTTAFLITGGLTLGGAAARTAGGAARTIPGVKPTLDFLGATATRRFVTGTGLALAQYEGISSGIQAFGTSGLTPEQKAIAKSSEFKSSLGQIFQTQRQELADQGKFKIPIGADRSISTGGFLFGISTSFGDEGQFIRIAKEQGLTPQEIDVALQVRSSKGIGELGAGLNLARFTEGFGRTEITKAFAAKSGKKLGKGAFRETFKTTAMPLFRAGVIEGAVGEFGQQRIREDPGSTLTKSLQVGGFGLAGGVSASLIGGTIAGLAPKTKLGSAAVETVASIADPLEKPGDLLEEVFEGAVKSKARTVVATPTILFTQEGRVALGVQQEAGPGIRRPEPKPQETIDIIMPGKKKPESFLLDTGSPIPSPTKQPIPSFAPTLTPIPIPEPSKKKGRPKTDTITDIITDTPDDTPTDVFGETLTQSNVLTETFTNVLSTVPVVTPQMRIPPPIPLDFPGGGRGAGRQVRIQKKFVNELAAGFSALGVSLGVPAVVPKTETRNGTTSKKKKGKKKKPQPFNIFGNGPTLPGGIRIL